MRKLSRDLITNYRSPAARITTRASTLLSLTSIAGKGYVSTDLINILSEFFSVPVRQFW